MIQALTFMSISHFNSMASDVRTTTIHLPEFNPADNVFQLYKANQVFESAEDVKTRASSVWEPFTVQSERIQSIGHHSWDKSQ